MIPSNWRLRRDQRGSGSVNAGDSELLNDLGDLVAAMHVESTRWEGSRGYLIWETAWTIDRIRLDLVQGNISAEDAAIWLASGVSVLTDTMRERSERNHPSGKGR